MPNRRDGPKLSQKALAVAFDALPIMIFVLDEGFTVQIWNVAASHVLGLSADEQVGRQLAGIPPHEHAGFTNFLTQVLKEEQHAKREVIWTKRDAENIRLEVTLSCLRDGDTKERYLLGVLEDMTEHYRSQYKQTLDKMDALSRFASAMAHDFNNLLANVDGYARFILGRHEPVSPKRHFSLTDGEFDKYLKEVQDEPDAGLSGEAGAIADEDHEDAERIVDQANRAAVLTSQLMTIGGGRPRPGQKALNINDTLKRMESTLLGLLGKGIELIIRASDVAKWALCDSFDFEQALTHLALNARDMMPEGGSLSIVTAPAEEADLFRLSLSRSRVPHVAISIIDTGGGIDAVALPHVFEPFYTIRGRKGGLGLCLAYNIVRRHAGEIEVKTNPGQGSIFSVYLPCPTDTADSTFVPLSQAADFRGTETILLVEDKFNIRYLISSALRARGYNVLVATGAAEALALYELDPVSIQLLLTDVVMPKGLGSELSRQLTARRPTLKTLYISAYPEWKFHDEGLLKPGVPFIQKPLTNEDLARKVRETLDGKLVIR